MKIPVIINNRNLLTWTRAMVERIKRYENVGDIIIVDNGSTYEPLLEWYKEGPCDVIMKPNLGHTAPWLSGVVGSLSCESYVVTDPDLGLEETPNDTLTVLEKNLPRAHGKIGLSLDWKAVHPESPYYGHIQSYERGRWEKSTVVDNIYYGVGIDTTFALYPKECRTHFTGGASLGHPYTAKHHPWYYTTVDRLKDKEFSYYLRHANGSCSYTRIGGGSVQKMSSMRDTNPELYNTDKFGEPTTFNKHHYDGFYDELFWDKRNKPITILEVGTWKGGAVRLFHDYLPEASIFGIDTDLLWNDVSKYPRLKLYNFDAYTISNWSNLPIQKFDIIIDDGPHNNPSQLIALREFPQFLNEGGMLIVEDVPKYSVKGLLDAIDSDRLKVYDWSWITNRYDDVIISYK